MALYPYDSRTTHMRLLAYLTPTFRTSMLAGTAFNCAYGQYEFRYRWHGEAQSHAVLIPTYTDFDKMVALIHTHMRLTQP